MYRDQSSWYLGVSSYWFANSFKWFLVLIFMPVLVSQHVADGEKNSVWGAVLMLGSIEAIVGPALWGALSDRAGRRIPFLLFGVGLTLVALGIVYKAVELVALALGYLLIQVADDVATGPFAALIPDRVPKEHRGRASGVLGALQAGSQVAAALMIASGAQVGAVFLTIGALQLLTAVWAWRTVKERPGDIARSTGGSRSSVFQMLKENANFRWVWLTRFLVSLGFTTLTTYGVYFIKDRVPVWQFLGKTFPTVQSAAGVVLISISLFGVLGALLAAKYADRIDRRSLIRASGWIMFLSMLPIGTMTALSPLALLASCFGLGYGIYASADWALAADTLEGDSWKARDMGIWQASIAVPQLIVGSFGLGIDLVNRSQPGGGYMAVFAMAAVLFLLGSLLVSRVQFGEPDLTN